MTKLHQLTLAAALLVGAGMSWFLLMRGATNHPKPPPAGGDPPPENALSLEDLPQNLASPDEHLRKAAQATLAQLPYQQRAWLRRQADQATNADAKAALETRLQQIEELLATNPPPISLHLKDANLAEVVDALNLELGTQLKFEPRGESPEGTYTLDVNHQPFWEVIVALNRQRAFRFDESYGVISLTDGREPHREAGMDRHMIVGPFFMFAVPRYLEPPNLGTPPATFRAARFELACKVFADPRMNVVDFGFGREDVTLGPDTLGNAFRITGGGGYMMHNAAVSGRIVSQQFIAAPDTVVAWVKADAEFTTAATGTSLEIPEVETAAAWKRDLGAGWISGTPFVPASMSTFSFQVGPPDVAAQLTLYLQSASGTPVWSLNGASGQQGTLTGTITKPDPPYTLRATLARTFKRKVTFEVQDIPLKKD